MTPKQKNNDEASDVMTKYNKKQLCSSFASPFFFMQMSQKFMVMFLRVCCQVSLEFDVETHERKRASSLMLLSMFALAYCKKVAIEFTRQKLECSLLARRRQMDILIEFST